MPFAYYQRLSPRQKRVYRRSDAVVSVELPEVAPLRPLVASLEAALDEERRRQITEVSRRVLDGLTQRLEVPPVRVVIYAVRPSWNWGELHGLYEPGQGRKPATISLWMRTAKRQQVVAFRTFLRTLLHELCHHLDFELLQLSDSFHTEGFYKRESSLFRQLVPKSTGRGAGARQGRAGQAGARPRR